MTARLAFTLELHRVAQAPLARAVANNRFGMLASDNARDNLSRSRLNALPKPYLVVVVANQTPQETSCARYLREWSSFAIVQAGIERIEDYRAIATIVPDHGRVLLIETLPHLAGDWLAFLDCRPRMDLATGRGDA